MSWPKGVSRKGYIPGTLRALAAGAPPPVSIQKRATPVNAIVLKAQSKLNPYEEIGRSGLKHTGGFLQDEFVQDLRGQKGARIYREMVDNSADLGAFMQLVKRMLQQVTWRFEPFSSTPVDKERAEYFDGALEDMEHSWPETLSEILTMLQYGYAPMEVTLKARRGWSKDPTKRSRFDDGLIGWRKMALRSQESVFRWIYDDDSRELVAMEQIPAPTYQTIQVPYDKLLNFRTDVERDSPEGRSLLRSAYWDYYWYKRLVAIGAIGAERDLNGIPVMSIPADCMRADASAEERAVHTRARQIVENLRVDEQAGIVLPNQYDPETKQPMFTLTLLSTSKGGSKIDVDKMLQRHQTNMLRAVLSDWMMLGTGTTGSWSLSSDRTAQFAVVLGGIMDIITGVMNRQAVPQLAQLNGWDLNELPTMKHGDVESPDLQKLAEFVSKTMAAGAITADSELEDFLREAAHLPVRLESDEDTGIETQPAKPAPPPVPPETPEAPETPEPDEPAEPEPAADQEAVKGAVQPRSRVGRWSPGSGDVAGALTLLRDRQRVGTGDMVAHGFRVAEEVPFPARREMTAEVEGAPVGQVELGALMATQPHVKRSVVRAFIQNPALVFRGQRNLFGTLEDHPVVVQHGGKRYIQDGHSRLAAKKLMGESHAFARVIDRGGDAPEAKKSQGGPDAPAPITQDVQTQEEP